MVEQEQQRQPIDLDAVDWAEVDPETGAVTVTLAYPIERTFKGADGERAETTKAVTLRRPKGKDLRLVGKKGVSEVEIGLKLIDRLSGADMPIADELDALDIDRLSLVIEVFTEGSRPTGGR